MTKPPLKLLLAEDVEDDALLTVDFLKDRFSVSYERVQDAARMREALQSGSWDVIISDWQMPRFDALEALRIAQAADSNLPFIIVSGTAGDDLAVSAMEAGAHDYFGKDNLTRLNAAVTRELREAEIRRNYARAAAQLEQRAAELYRSNRELERFAYVAAHDLQEPLRMVTSYSELLLSMVRPHVGAIHDAEQIVGFIREGIDRMESLIAGLLSYSKLVHDTEQDLQTVDAALAAGGALRHLESAIQETRATVAVEDLPHVRADRTQLTQVFQNLVGNALKYRHPNTAPEVRVSAWRSGGNWTFAVRDNGIGIPPEHHERIFHIFKRLHREEYPGLGIGLALTKRFVEMHGGSIWVESAPGEGSTFFFTIPTAEQEGVDDA